MLGPGPRRTLLGGKPNDKDQEDAELQGPDSTGPPLNKPHKNDLPLADQAELEMIKKDPTVVLEIGKIYLCFVILHYYSFPGTTIIINIISKIKLEDQLI